MTARDDLQRQAERDLDMEFHRLAEARDLAPAYELLCRFRDELSRSLLRQFGTALGGEAGVEQVVVDALRKAILKAFQFDPERGSLRTWLYRIAGNSAFDEIAEARRGRARGSEPLFDQIACAEPTEEPPVDALRRAVEKLPQRERVILKARYRKRPLPDQELSVKLGCTVGHVHNVRSRVIKKLRDQMKEER